MKNEEWEKLYQMRIERLNKLIKLKAPAVIIDKEAEMVRDAFIMARGEQSTN